MFSLIDFLLGETADGWGIRCSRPGAGDSGAAGGLCAGKAAAPGLARSALLSHPARTLISGCTFLPNLAGDLNYTLLAEPDAWPKRCLVALRKERAIK